MLWRYTRSIPELKNLANRLAGKLSVILANYAQTEVAESAAQIGSRSLPIDQLPSIAVVIHSQQFSITKITKVTPVTKEMG